MGWDEYRSSQEMLSTFVGRIAIMLLRLKIEEPELGQ